MKEPVELLLRILVNGGRVEHGGYEFAMNHKGALCCVMKEFGTDREWAYEIDCDLKGFKSMADDIGRDELWLKCCALQLQELNSKDRI